MKLAKIKENSRSKMKILKKKMSECKIYMIKIEKKMSIIEN